VIRAIVPGMAVACAALAGAAAWSADAAPSIRIDDAWIRWLPGNLPAAGYTTLTNSGEEPVILTGASSPAYGDVSLHRSRTQAGNVEMVPVERIPIGPHASLSFAAAGYHLMLMQPNRPIQPGDHVPITLHFAGGSSLTVSFAVHQPDSAPPRRALPDRVGGTP
jgi:copper(I)-binding protein